MYIQSQHKFDKQPREIGFILVFRTLAAESNLFMSTLYSLKVFIKKYLNFSIIIKRKELFALICSELYFTTETFTFNDFYPPLCFEGRCGIYIFTNLAPLTEYLLSLQIM